MITDIQQLDGVISTSNKLVGSITSNNSIEGASVNVGVVTEKDYTKLTNKPKINDVTLIGNVSLEALDIQETMSSLTNLEIESIIGD